MARRLGYTGHEPAGRRAVADPAAELRIIFASHSSPRLAGVAATIFVMLTICAVLAPGTGAERTAGGPPARLVLPAIGVDATVTPLPLNRDRSMPAPPDGTVAAWYTYSADAGGRGNAVLAGHRDWGGRVGTFYRLGALVEGDEVWLQDGRGGWYLYRVSWSISIPEDSAPVAALLGTTDEPSLTLITCSGTFSRRAGQYVERRLVRAVLVNSASSDDGAAAHSPR